MSMERPLVDVLPSSDARSLDILNALLDRGATLTLPDDSFDRKSLLLQNIYYCNVDIVARLLQYPCVRATVNEQTIYVCERTVLTGNTMISSLLRACANPALTDVNDKTPAVLLRERQSRKSRSYLPRQYRPA